MSNWSDLFHQHLVSRYGEVPEADAFVRRMAWAEDLHERARTLLDPEALQTMPPQEIYSCLKQLGVPQCPVRIAHLGRVNDAQRVIDGLVRLLTTQGGFAEKYRAAKFPQAGVVTLTELLCIARPVRFLCRNTAVTRAMAKVVPLYTKKALDELPYEEFMDMARELARILEDWLKPAGLAEWAARLRFLLLYAVLTDSK